MPFLAMLHGMNAEVPITPATEDAGEEGVGHGVGLPLLNLLEALVEHPCRGKPATRRWARLCKLKPVGMFPPIQHKLTRISLAKGFVHVLSNGGPTTSVTQVTEDSASGGIMIHQSQDSQ